MRKLRTADQTVVNLALMVFQAVQLMGIAQALINQKKWAKFLVALPYGVRMLLAWVLLGKFIRDFVLGRLIAYYDSNGNWPETYDVEFGKRFSRWYTLALIVGGMLAGAKMYGSYVPLLVLTIVVLLVEEWAYRRKYRTTREARLSWKLRIKAFKKKMEKKADDYSNPRAENGLSSFKNNSAQETVDTAPKKQTGPKAMSPEQKKKQQDDEVAKILDGYKDIVEKTLGTEAAGRMFSNDVH